MANYFGSAIISNTQIYEVGRLIYPEASDDFSLDLTREEIASQEAQRAFDLMTIIDAIILNDKLYTLPARANNEKNPFFEALTKEKIVKTISDPDLATNTQRLLFSQLQEVKNFYSDEDSISGRDAFEKIEQYYSNINGNRSFEAGKSKIIPFEWNYNKSISDLNPEENRSLLEWLGLFSSIRYKDASFYLRDMAYIFSAEYLEVAYYPQSNRKKFADKFPNYYDVNFKTKLYTKISEALEKNISEVYDDLNDKVTFIPPFSSIVLSRSKSRKDVLENILTLRDEFSKTRKGFNELEQERRESKKLKKRLKITRKQQQLLLDASKNYDAVSKINLESSIKYIPELIKPITSPHNPTSYSANLLLLPIDSLLEWWRKRPIIKMYSMKDKILEIEEYDKLLKKLFPQLKPNKR